MKKILSLMIVISILTACSSTVVVRGSKPLPPGQAKKTTAPLPPGQAKKVTGSQSAKPYAPGQQKKKK